MIATFRVGTGALICLALCSLPASVFAQAPSITSTSPQAVRPGETIDVKISGGNLAGATQLWTSFPAKSVLAPGVKDNGKSNSLVTFRIAVPAKTHVGIHAIRITTPRGTSTLKLLAVDDLPSMAQQAKNTSRASAQSVPTQIAIDGAVPSLGYNYYKFQVEAGQRVAFEVLARRFGSPLDPTIKILDSRGRQLTYNNDDPALSLDARLAYTFNAAGEYFLEIHDNSYRGGATYRYRLRIGDFPIVSVPYPMGAKRGSEVTLNFAGVSKEPIEPLKIKIPADPTLDWLTIGAKRTDGSSSVFTTLALSDRDEFLETEPNNQADKSNRVALGTNLNGRIQQSGDVDRFVFAAKKGQRFTFQAITRRQGSPSDLVLRLLKPDGAQISEVDDSGINDAKLDYTFPADGDYTLSVTDKVHNSGGLYAYRITVAESKTGFSLSASADRLNIPAGGIATVTVNTARLGYNGPIDVSLANLPAGITSLPTVIGPGRNTVVLTVSAKADVKPGELHSVRVVGKAKIGKADVQTVASITATLKKQFSDMPFPPLQLSEATSLAVAPKPAFVLRTEPAQIVFGRDLKATVKVIVVRTKGFDEAIALAVTPAKIGLPPGITAAAKPIPKGKNEALVVFSATAKAPMGAFTGVLVGTHKKGKVTTSSTAPGIGLKLQSPMTVTLNLGDGKLKKGGQLKVKATVARNPALKAEISVTFQNLPKGVTAAAAKIAPDKNEVEILLSAAQDAQVGTVKNLTIKGDAAIGKVKFSATSAAGSLIVE